MIKNLLYIGLGGGIGSMLRFAVSMLVPAKTFPFATFIVNIVGCFIIGLVYALSLKENIISPGWKLFLATGLCGGFTTFSAFSLENMGLLQSGKFALLFVYITLSIVLGIAATFAGYLLLKS